VHLYIQFYKLCGDLIFGFKTQSQTETEMFVTLQIKLISNLMILMLISTLKHFKNFILIERK